tara:strand:+ start:44 stop:313 length:270 start_codon:yes stop_codon:yes gene_type:complete
MSRRIIIDKYQGNTHYNVHVIDSFGQEHHVGYFDEMDNFSQSIIEDEAETIWSNETKREIDPLSSAIHKMVQTGKKFLDERGNHRDGLD